MPKVGGRARARMTLWFTSDEHYGHSKVIEYCARPFDDLDDMHAQLISRHNAVVQAGDTVYHLGVGGDFCFKAKLMEQILRLWQIRCRNWAHRSEYLLRTHGLKPLQAART